MIAPVSQCWAVEWPGVHQCNQKSLQQHDCSQVWLVTMAAHSSY